MKRTRAALVAMTTVAMAVATFTPAPAQAAASVIDIGVTIHQNGKIKGSGSTTNNGDYTNVCIVIMARLNPSNPGTYFMDASMACKSQRGQWVWSAPDVTANPSCTAYYTRISAYKNGKRVDNKNSNTIYVGSGRC